MKITAKCEIHVNVGHPKVANVFFIMVGTWCHIKNYSSTCSMPASLRLASLLLLCCLGELVEHQLQERAQCVSWRCMCVHHQKICVSASMTMRSSLSAKEGTRCARRMPVTFARNATSGCTMIRIRFVQCYTTHSKASDSTQSVWTLGKCSAKLTFTENCDVLKEQFLVAVCSMFPHENTLKSLLNYIIRQPNLCGSMLELFGEYGPNFMEVHEVWQVVVGWGLRYSHF